MEHGGTRIESGIETRGKLEEMTNQINWINNMMVKPDKIGRRRKTMAAA